MLYIRRLSACRLARTVHVQSCTCQPDGFCTAPDTIAYAKVSGVDSIAWPTQLHLTPFLTMFYAITSSPFLTTK